MGSPRLTALELGEAERAALETLAARRRTAQGLALRARIVLACAETGSPRLVGARLGVHPDTATQVAPPVCPASVGRAARRASFGRTAQDR